MRIAIKFYLLIFSEHSAQCIVHIIRIVSLYIQLINDHRFRQCDHRTDCQKALSFAENDRYDGLYAN